MDSSYWFSVLDLGLVIGLALAVGIVAERFRIPDVSAFLLTGLFLGPHFLGVISEHDIHFFEPIARVAMALVLFEIGCHFTIRRVRTHFRRISRISLCELATTACAVGLGLLLLPSVELRLALMLAFLALETAPATTMLVLQETDSEGPVTDTAVFLIVLNNLACLIGFELLLTALISLATPATGFSELGKELLLLCRDVLGAMTVGTLAGLTVAYFARLVDKEHWFALLIAVVVATLGVASLFELPYLLTFFAMGATVANATEEAGSLVTEVKHLTTLLCVLFFATHGAEMDISALVQSGIIGVAYLVLRPLGKYVGVRLGAHLVGADQNVRRWLGLVLFAHAGTALAMVSMAAQRTAGVPGLEEVAAQAKTIILGTIIVFELVGPLLIRFAVVQAGEVPVARAIRHVTTGPVDELRSLSQRILETVGLRKQVVAAATLPVKELMRRTFRKLPLSASFDDIVKALQESHQDTFPVVDSQDRLVGLIRYDDLRDVLFDPTLGELVRADDLAVPAPLILRPDTPLREIWNKLSQAKDDVVPVVNEEGVLVGVLRPRDVFRLVLEAGQEQGASPSETVQAVEHTAVAGQTGDEPEAQKSEAQESPPSESDNA